MLNEDLGFPGRSLIQAVLPNEPKLERLEAKTPQLERGLVLIPEKEALWLPEFKRELLAFPNGRYDDQVDAFSQFLWWTATRGAKTLTSYVPPRRFPQAFRRTAFGDPLLDPYRW
jgi:phage terminase large subunit-like protein